MKMTHQEYINKFRDYRGYSEALGGYALLTMDEETGGTVLERVEFVCGGFGCGNPVADAKFCPDCTNRRAIRRFRALARRHSEATRAYNDALYAGKKKAPALRRRVRVIEKAYTKYHRYIHTGRAYGKPVFCRICRIYH